MQGESRTTEFKRGEREEAMAKGVRQRIPLSGENCVFKGRKSGECGKAKKFEFSLKRAKKKKGGMKNPSY